MWEQTKACQEGAEIIVATPVSGNDICKETGRSRSSCRLSTRCAVNQIYYNHYPHSIRFARGHFVLDQLFDLTDVYVLYSPSQKVKWIW